MELASRTGQGPRVAFSIEKVRSSFPALQREIHGRPLVYLDSGASSQRVAASIQAVDRYERRHHANVHRGSHTLSAEATEAFEGARATVADHIGAADRREVVFVRNATEAINLVARAWGDANLGAGDRIVLTEMEHHSNIVPWQQLAKRVGAEIDWAPIDAGGPSRPRRACKPVAAAAEAGLADPRLKRLGDRESSGRDCPHRPPGGCRGPGRRSPGGAEAGP